MLAIESKAAQWYICLRVLRHNQAVGKKRDKRCPETTESLLVQAVYSLGRNIAADEHPKFLDQT